MNSNLMIKRIYLEKEKMDSWENYPFTIENVKNFESIEFQSPVTFLIGENNFKKTYQIFFR